MQNDVQSANESENFQRTATTGIDEQIQKVFTELELLPQELQMIFCSRLLHALAEKINASTASKAILAAHEVVSEPQTSHMMRNGRGRSKVEQGVTVMLESRLLELHDPQNPIEAWEHFEGEEALLNILAHESVGSLELLLRHPLMPSGKAPRGKTNKAIAKAIVERLAAHMRESESRTAISS